VAADSVVQYLARHGEDRVGRWLRAARLLAVGGCQPLAGNLVRVGGQLEREGLRRLAEKHRV